MAVMKSPVVSRDCEEYGVESELCGIRIETMLHVQEYKY